MEWSLRLLTARMSSSMEKEMERNYFSAWAKLAGTPVWTRVLTGIESTSFLKLGSEDLRSSPSWM